MPRSIWNGTVALGLLSVPVKVYSATESKTVHFHEVHLRDGARVEHRRVCTKEDREVPYAEVVKGYEVAGGEYVVLDDDEVKAAAGDRGHRIDVEHAVGAADIDPVFYDRTYYLGAGKDGDDAYRLLHDALDAGGRAAIGRWTFHDRERLAVVRPRDGVLVLHTLRFADEIVPPGDVEVREPQKAPARREVDMAGQLVESLHEDFDPDRYEDEYRKAVLEVVQRKARGEDVAPAQEDVPEPSDDLMAALQASLKGTKKKAGAR